MKQPLNPLLHHQSSMSRVKEKRIWVFTFSGLKILSSRRWSGKKECHLWFVYSGRDLSKIAVTWGTALLWLTEAQLQSTAAVNTQGHTWTCKMHRMPTVCECSVWCKDLKPCKSKAGPSISNGGTAFSLVHWGAGETLYSTGELPL